jgi:hypothetical protein
MIMFKKQTIEFEKTECELIYWQLSARKEDFEGFMVEAANDKDSKRVIECAKTIECIKTILGKILNN